MKATKEMIAAGAEAARKYMEEAGGNNPAVIWDAMWAAQPKEPEQSDVVSGKTFDRIVALNESNAARVLELEEKLEALAQAKHNPVGFYDAENKDLRREIPMGEDGDWWQPLYTTPPQRKPLDIKTIKRIATYCGEHITDEDVIEITKRVEEEHKIKEET